MVSIRSSLSVFLIVGASALMGCVGAGRTALFEEEAPAEWRELESPLPPYPADADLIPFAVSAQATARFFVDGRTLALGDDGIVRYSMVVRAAGGAENVSYEGIRCATAERKIYALGRQGAWSRSRNDEWVRIVDSGGNRHHAVLAKDFFCPPGAILPTRAEILRSLRSTAPY